MSEITLEFDHVWKKFKRGEIYDSLRDLIPAVTRGLLRRGPRSDLEAREFWATEDVSFQVRRGEAFGIIGANGAGKSTALKLLSRILTPTRGRILTRGRLSALIEVGAGFHPDLTGRENVYLNGSILGMKRAEIAAKFDEIVDFAGMAAFIDTPVKRYSSGMYARLGFAVAAHVEPEILVVDEVLSVGDMPFQEKCFDRMRRVVENGTTVVFVSHNLQAVQMLCGRAMLLHHGRTTAIGETRDVVAAYVRAAQGGAEAVPDGPVSQFQITDGEGEIREQFRPGEHAVLRMSFAPTVPLEQCRLSFIVQRLSDGEFVCDYNFELKGWAEAGADPRSGRVPLEIEFDVNLLRGAYGVLLNLQQTLTSRFLARNVNAGMFTVAETFSYSGMAHLKPVLRPGAPVEVASGSSPALQGGAACRR